MMPLYDQIGIGYARLRRPDPRLAARICQVLGAPEMVVRVGAGAGSYEPLDRHVIAVEPSLTMIQQRPRGSAPVVRASATHLPFKDGALAAGRAVLTVHHWPDRARGLRELARVARERVVVVTWDPACSGFWLIDDYFPAIGALDRHPCPTAGEFQRVLGSLIMRPPPIPHDCTDGFLGAYWRRRSPLRQLNTCCGHHWRGVRVLGGVRERNTYGGINQLVRLRASSANQDARVILRLLCWRRCR